MRIKVGIIGCGRIARRHAGHIQNLAELTALYDIRRERAEELSSEFGGKATSSLEEFLDQPMDVVAVCSPNGLHAEHSIRAMEAGFHVLCEKPMAIKRDDCEKMILTAEKTGRKLFVVKQNRYNPAVAAVKERLDRGDFGKLYSVQLNCFWNRNEAYYAHSDWKGTLELDGGTLFTQFSHFIDLLYWMLGDFEHIVGFKANYHHDGIIEFEDSGVMSVQFKNGVTGTINYTVNSYKQNMEGSITLFGEKGTVKIGGQYLNKLEYEMLDELIGELPPGNPANEYGQYQGSMSNHDRVYENLIAVLQDGAKIGTTGLEGLKTVEIIERMYQAMRDV